ncbi:carbohydrate esterase family 1 protein [Hyaloscypha hepaticicola]|uniref:Carbohydrate esterase family 1 protein n=1 Tax=Hyaloscypha hepaticicola TaxID=2082293 RepID=A0A2J6PKT6_9HELO|nr:carbohydrate esterase family 1 protein [Hyaloscypha hepaticicola]
MDQLELDQLTSSEFNTQSIVVYLQGINDTWQGVPAIGYRNDVQFTTDILDEVESLYCINPSRITATGNLTEPGSTIFLPATRYFQSVLQHLLQSRELTISTHFLAILPLSISHVPQPEWALRDGLDLGNVTTNVAVNVTRYAFGRGAEAGLVELYYESNIGHDWPSTRSNADNTASGHHVANYNATPIIMSFFEAHPLSVLETIEDGL